MERGNRSYRELMQRQDGPPGSAWRLFGDDDNLGTLNRLTPARTRAAAALVRKGSVFNLDHPINAFAPYPSGTRFPATHTIFSNHENQRDDYLDGFYMQGTTQLDGLRHARHPIHGFYNGVSDEEVRAGSPALGIQILAEQGIAGRGVLLDVERHLAALGRPIDQLCNHAITVDDLVATAGSQGVVLQYGDLLLIRTGWTRHFLEDLSPAEREALPDALVCPGLEQTLEMIGWLWDQGFSIVAADNFALEAFPPVAHTEFSYRDPDSGVLMAPQVEGLLHPQLIALLGFTIGEMWALDDLARDCAADGVYEFLCVVKPLNLPGGVGSPANATAVK